MRIGRSAVTVVFLILIRATSAPALFHLMQIDEIYFGTEDCPAAQYVMLRMTAGGQTVVRNQTVSLFDAAGAPAENFGTFGANVTNGLVGSTILMGTAEAQALFGVPFDQVVTGRLPFPSGRVCFVGQQVDCVAYGNYTGQTNSGDPAPTPVIGMALARMSDMSNDAADFQLAPPMPENNAGTVGQLGECPEPPTPTPTATPRATRPPGSYVCPGDCNRDGEVVISELVTSLSIMLDESEVDDCLDADVDENGAVAVDELLGSVDSGLNGCPPLGTRRFSIDPRTSPFSAVVQGLGAFPTFGFEGFLELRGGVPIAGGVLAGNAFVEITDSSEYISVFVPPQGGTEGIALCLRPHRERFPISAGIIDCDGGVQLGIMTSQDHNIGVEGQCLGGDNGGAACSTDAECPGGECFSGADCTAAGGVVDDVHPDVCNGPLNGGQFGEPSQPGDLVIAANEFLRTEGLPADLLMETALPCGDEEVPGVATPFAFTTSAARAEVIDVDNTPDETFDYETRGESFSCRDFATENGPGTLVLAVPTLHALLGSDLISAFALDD